MNGRILTNKEKMVQDTIGMEGTMFNMGENKIEDLIAKDKLNKYNDQVDAYAERVSEHFESLKETQSKIDADFEKLEIKPLNNRLLITPFKQNPFQRVKVENGIITDLGGLAPEFKNMDNGQIEEMEQAILTGCVQEVGPEVKWIEPGDVIMYRKETVMPVPFFKQGLMCLAETQVIAVINVGLDERFNAKKNG